MKGSPLAHSFDYPIANRSRSQHQNIQISRLPRKPIVLAHHETAHAMKIDRLLESRVQLRQERSPRLGHSLLSGIGHFILLRPQHRQNIPVFRLPRPVSANTHHLTTFEW